MSTVPAFPELLSIHIYRLLNLYNYNFIFMYSARVHMAKEARACMCVLAI